MHIIEFEEFVPDTAPNHQQETIEFYQTTIEPVKATIEQVISTNLLSKFRNPKLKNHLQKKFQPLRVARKSSIFQLSKRMMMKLSQ